ncbi:MAG: hypothetical protein ABI838_07530 [Chloroflexota bacterium]
MSDRLATAILAATATCWLAACSSGGQPAARASASASATPGRAEATATPAPTAAPTPALPAYYIESLRARP